MTAEKSWIEKHDGMVLAKTGAWHGLGVVVEEAPTPYQALHLAGMNWEVGTCPLYGLVESEGSAEPTRVVYENRFGLYRKDVNVMLGNCSEHYVPIQNIQVADLIYDVAQTEDIKVESAGSLKNGQRIFFLVQLGSMGLQNGDDVIKQYALFHSGHDGRTGLSVRQTNIRVVCANTERLAMRDSSIKLRHMGENAYDLNAIRAKLGDIKAQALEFEKTMEKAIQTEWDFNMLNEYFIKTYKDGTVSGLPTNTESRAYKTFEKTLATWHDYASKHEHQANCFGTAYAGYQAVTQYASHDMHVRKRANVDAIQARNLNTLFGKGDALGSAASKNLVKLLG
jgi:phage/plasmid-like protein (TIGR03299 family)|tara:strand:+ start:1020 stop:2033 length:1014 start_codon:yes stop_codon:yes gene_type:complete